jgi:transposase InsO family protein
MIKELMKKFEIKHIFSTSYHPKTNGLVERFNKTLCESLGKLKKDQNWIKK